MKKIVIVIALAFFFLAGQVSAVSTLLTKIGALDISTQYKHWWYTSQNPVLSGTSTAGATITVSIDSVSTTATADTNGVWSAKPTTLLNGDHTMIISSATESYPFTLTIGSLPPEGTASSSADGNTIPTTGTNWPTVMLLGLGMLILIPSTALALRKE